MKLPYIKLLQVRRFKKKNKIKTFSKIVPLKFGLDKITVRIKVGKNHRSEGQFWRVKQRSKFCNYSVTMNETLSL